MKKLLIGLIVACSLVACRNGPKNARGDTTGMGSNGTAGGLLPADTGTSTGGAAAQPAAMTTDTTKRDTTKRDTTHADTTKHHKKSHKRS